MTLTEAIKKMIVALTGKERITEDFTGCIELHVKNGKEYFVKVRPAGFKVKDEGA